MQKLTSMYSFFHNKHFHEYSEDLSFTCVADTQLSNRSSLKTHV